MATAEAIEEAPKGLKCQTWVLKVSVHCQGCKRRVKKVLQGIDGVYTTTIDSQQQRVTVTGNIEAETLIKKLIKTGKHAEIWPEKLTEKGKESGKAKNMNGQKNPTGDQKYSSTDKGSKKSVKFSRGTKEGGKLAENSAAADELPEIEKRVGESEGGGGAKSGGKKKKNKGAKGDNNGNSVSSSGSSSFGTVPGNGYQALDQVLGPSNLNRTRQHSVPCLQGFYVPAMCAPSYSMACPPGESHGPFYLENTNQATTTTDSFYIFSDENVNGCSIM